MRLIDADAAKEPWQTDNQTAITMRRIFDGLPTVDAIPVVRCGECVHQYRQDYGPLAGARFCNVWCMINGMGDDGFCNYGDRKEGSGND